MNIVYTCQENYANVAGVSIYSLLKHNAGKEIHIYFLDSGVSLESRERMSALCKSHGKATIEFFLVTDLLQEYSDKLTAFQSNFATYAKLFVEILLPKNIDECLYIDADTLIVDSIEDVFADKNDYTLYMGYDFAYTNYKEKLGLQANAPYYNAGVIFLNLKKWREKNYSEKIIMTLQQKTHFTYGDQDIFNTLFYGDIGALPFGYNTISQFFFYDTTFLRRHCFATTDDTFYRTDIFDLQKIHIIHFTYMPFILRPWFVRSNHPYVKLYRRYVQESPYAETFIYADCPQPMRRKIVQFLLKYDSLHVLRFVVGAISKRLHAK